MTASLIILFVFLGLYLISFATKCCLLLLGLRWNKITDYTRGKIILATLLIEGLGLAMLVTTGFDQWVSPRVAGLLLLGSLGLWVVFSCAIIARVFKASSFRAFLIWLVTLIPAPGLMLFLIFVLRPYICEAYKIPTNSMAPTIVGVHHEGVCSKCGKPNYCSAIEQYYGQDQDEPQKVICTEFHVTDAIPTDLTTYPGDRILVAKFLTPQRWDLVAFRYPENPSINFVKRLVGLPGETITIKNGKVYANGQELTPPAEIQGIEYLTEMPTPDGESILVNWGTEDQPAVLGDGEYFMLGDFSPRAKDSRLWDRGAEGHPPYAVPEELMIGVVTHIYWPLSRYRTFR